VEIMERKILSTEMVKVDTNVMRREVIYPVTMISKHRDDPMSSKLLRRLEKWDLKKLSLN